MILNETDLGYVTSQNQKLNHLLFMDDLQLYAKSESIRFAYPDREDFF